MDHTKPLEGLGGLEMELKGKLFKFSLLFPILIRPYLGLFDIIWHYLGLVGPNKFKQEARVPRLMEKRC